MRQHTPAIVAYIYIKGAAKKFLSHSSLIYVICTSPPLVCTLYIWENNCLRFFARVWIVTMMLPPFFMLLQVSRPGSCFWNVWNISLKKDNAKLYSLLIRISLARSGAFLTFRNCSQKVRISHIFMFWYFKFWKKYNKIQKNMNFAI